MSSKSGLILTFVGLCLWALWGGLALAQQPNVFAPVADSESFDDVKSRMVGNKNRVIGEHRTLLQARYDLSDRPSQTVSMSGGKPIQTGIRVKLPSGVSWNALANLSPAEIRTRNVFPQGFLPLPHPNHPEGGMLFPASHIDMIKQQEGRDLSRFDLDFVMPEYLLAESPAPIYLTTRTDLGDVSQGKLVTLTNYYDLFGGILNPKQLDGLRLLLTPFPQQQFNATIDRRSVKPSQGVACLDCHANGHTNAATHLVGDIRPQEFRHRIDTPTLRA